MLKHLLVFLCFLLPGAAEAQSVISGFNIGSTTDDYSHVIKVAPNGNVYMAGKFTGTMDLDPGPGVFNVTSAGNDDIFLACYSPTGTFLWGFGIGGPLEDAVWQMNFDQNSNVIINGWIQSGGIDFDPGPGVAIMPFAGGSGLPYYGDAFIAEYSSTGAYMWGHNVGGYTVYDHGESVTTDPAGNVYFSGEADVSFSIGPYTFSTGIVGQAFIAKYSPTGAVIWAHAYGLPGTSSTDCHAWSLRYGHGYLYVGGTFQATSNFDPWGTPAYLTSVGYYDSYIAKYDTAGNFVWVKQIIGSGTLEEVLNVELDASDNMYVIGYTNSPSMTFDPSSPGTSTFSSPGGGGNYDMFMAKYDKNGAYQWGHILGSSGDDYGWQVEVNGGYLYVTGDFHNTIDMDPSPAVANLTSTGGYDLYVGKYDLNGNYICAFSVGSPVSDDIGYGLAHDTANNLYLSGQFGGTAVDFDPSPAVFPLTSIGGTDAFLVKYSYGTSGTITGHLVGDTICAGDPAHLTLVITSGPPGPYTITITDGTSTFTVTVTSGVPFTLPVSPSTTTTYSLTSISYPGMNICTAPSVATFGTATIVVNPLPAAPITATPLSCDQFTFSTLSGNPVTTWNLGDGTTAATNPVTHTYLSPGTYNVKLIVTSAAGCSAADSTTVTVTAPPTVDLGPDTSLCLSASTYTIVPVSVTPPSASFLWSDGTTGSSLTVNTGGIYWLTVSSNGCSAKDSVKITIKQQPEVVLHDTEICPGHTIVIGSPEPPGAQYLWSSGSTDSSISITDSGTYSLTVNLKGCTASAAVTVIYGQTQNINLGPDTTLCIGQAIELTVDNDAAIWSNGHQGSSIDVKFPGLYWVELPAACGIVRDSIKVDFHPCFIGFPSAFTPNGDGLNDIIGVEGTLKYYTDFSLSIFNRWGQRVFYTEDIYQGWDGIFNGTKQDLGTYMYMIYYTIEGKKYMMKGDFQLIR